MRGWNFIGNVSVALATLVILAVMAAPVIHDMAQGLGSTYHGTGRMSGVVLFLLMAPVTFSLYLKPLHRLVGVGVSTAVSTGVMILISLFEAGRHTTGLMTLAAMVGMSVGFYSYLKSREAKQAEGTERLVDLVSQVVTATTKQLRERYRGEFYKPFMPNAPIHSLPLAENLAMGLIWQAAMTRNTEDFASEILQKLCDLRDDMHENHVTDPEGYAGAALDLYLVNVQRYLESNGIKAGFRPQPKAASHGEYKTLRQRPPMSVQPPRRNSDSGTHAVA